MANPAEKRKHPRIDLILKVEYESPGDFLADYASNASHGGLFIATQRSFKVGETLAFSISFPGLLDPIQCRGEVRWCRAGEQASEAEPAGIGVAFRFDSAAEAEAIRAVVNRLAGAAAPVPLEGAPLGEPQVAPPEPAPGRLFRVIVIEDNKVVRDMFHFALRKFHGVRMSSRSDLEVTEAENGQQGWERLQAGPFDLAIVDLYMPILDGEHLIRKIRQSETLSALPIIAVSAGGPDAQKLAYEAGADLFLNKPVMLVQLFTSLQRLLGIESVRA